MSFWEAHELGAALLSLVQVHLVGLILGKTDFGFL